MFRSSAEELTLRMLINF